MYALDIYPSLEIWCIIKRVSILHICTSSNKFNCYHSWRKTNVKSITLKQFGKSSDENHMDRQETR